MQVEREWVICVFVPTNPLNVSGQSKPTVQPKDSDARPMVAIFPFVYDCAIMRAKSTICRENTVRGGQIAEG